MPGEGTQPVESGEAAGEICGKFANYRVDFMTSRGADRAFTCADHLAKILPQAMNVARGGCARVQKLSGTSDEPCEVD